MTKKILFVSLFLVSIVLTGLFHSLMVYSEETAADKAISYLKSQPQTAWGSMALAGNGESNLDLNHLKTIPLERQSATSYAKNILGLVANAKDPTNFGDEDYVARLKSYYQDNQFGSKELLNDDVWAILALGAIGQANLNQVQTAKDYILTFQNQDGGWGYSTSSTSDTNSTAAVIMALLETGLAPNSAVISSAVNYLKLTQNNDGGFPYALGNASDSCSGAWVASTIYKLGQNPADGSWQNNNNNVLDFLWSFQDADGGFWWQGSGDNKFCSPYVTLALLGKFYPVKASLNTHKIRIEGGLETICNAEVAGGTAMNLITEAAEVCSYDYTIIEYPGLGLYLSSLANEENWMYMVNNVPAMVGADNYYLNLDDQVLWYSGQWLDNGWLVSDFEISKTESQAIIQVKYYNNQTNEWNNLAQPVKIQVGLEEMTADASGKLTLNLNNFNSGFYVVFVKKQIISEVGYIRSAKQNLNIGAVPSDHQVGLIVEIEKIDPPLNSKQDSISFSLSPSLLDFGKLKAGQTSVQQLTFNNGNFAIYLKPEITGDSVFRDNIKFNKSFWQNFEAIAGANEQKVFEIELAIPLNFFGEAGVKQGELTFWGQSQ